MSTLSIRPGHLRIEDALKRGNTDGRRWPWIPTRKNIFKILIFDKTPENPVKRVECN